MTRAEAERIAARLVTVAPRDQFFACVVSIAGSGVASERSERHAEERAKVWRDAIVRALVEG